MSTLENLAALVRDLGAERASAVRAIEELRQQRDALETAPLPRQDFVAMLGRYVDGTLERFDANVRLAIERIVHRPSIALRDFPFVTMMNGSGALDEGLITALLSDAIKRRLRSIVAGMDWPEAGPPLAERPALRLRLDDEIATAQGALDHIDAELAKIGLKIEEPTHGS